MAISRLILLRQKYINSCVLSRLYLIVCVINILYETCYRCLHQHKECELPGEIHHQGDHAHSFDKCPQQHIDIKTNCHSHQFSIFGQS